MQIKTSMRYHFTSVRMLECGGKETLVHCWWVCKLVQPLWKSEWRFLKKLKTELRFDPVFPPLGIYVKKTKILTPKDIFTASFITALFTTAKIWNNLTVHLRMNG